MIAVGVWFHAVKGTGILEREPVTAEDAIPRIASLLASLQAQLQSSHTPDTPEHQYYKVQQQVSLDKSFLFGSFQQL